MALTFLERNALLSTPDLAARTMIAARTRATEIVNDQNAAPAALQLAGKIMRAPVEWAKIIAVGVVTTIHPDMGLGTEDDPIGPNDAAFQYTVNVVLADLIKVETVV